MFIFQYKKYLHIYVYTHISCVFLDFTLLLLRSHLFLILDRYSPTILLLRHFDVFRNLASHEGSPNDHVGITSEVASVLREFTEPVPEDGEIDSEGKVNGEFVRCNDFASTLSCFRVLIYHFIILFCII